MIYATFFVKCSIDINMMFHLLTWWYFNPAEYWRFLGTRAEWSVRIRVTSTITGRRTNWSWTFLLFNYLLRTNLPLVQHLYQSSIDGHPLCLNMSTNAHVLINSYVWLSLHPFLLTRASCTVRTRSFVLTSSPSVPVLQHEGVGVVYEV